VLDLELGGGMGWVDVPGSCGDGCSGDGGWGHGRLLLLKAWMHEEDIRCNN
jgi:hypothetical protein